MAEWALADYLLAGAVATGTAYASSEMAKGSGGKMRAAPSPTTGPSPTTVMAAERAELDRGLKKRRKAASVMGGDYGALNVQQNKLGT